MTEVNWKLVDTDEQLENDENHLIIPLRLWMEERDRYSGRTDVAIWLDSHEEAGSIADDLDQFQFVALNFPSYRDGRAYSSASILRRNLHFKGQLCAIGDVRHDQLEEMSRCGFDKFHLTDGSILTTDDFKHFSYTYQSSADNSKPLYRTENLN